MNGDNAYEVVWTPAFFEEVYLAIDYIANILKMPRASTKMLAGIQEALKRQSLAPTAAIRRTGARGETYYAVSYHHFDIYYTIEQHTIKAVGLKHQLQQRGLPRRR